MSCLAPDGTNTTLSDAILEIASVPELRAEAEASLALLKAQARQADAQEMVKLMQAYQEPFNKVPRDKEQWKAFWLVYIEALEGISLG